MSGLSEVNPFVGPRPIQQGEALHGRELEVRELYNKLQARRIVVLHSPSGAGKSSLVQAGLIPALRADNFDVWKPIRLNLDPSSFEGLPEGTNRYVLSAMVSLEEELPPKRRRSPAELAQLDFLSYLEKRPRRKRRVGDSVVLLFDQFEEVLSVAPRAVAAKEEFFAAVGEALDTDKYWALFIIREDYLAALAPYRDLIPTQLFNTFRLDLLGPSGAREAAVKLAEKGGRSFPAVDKLIHDLSTVQVQQADGTFVTEQGLHVEPVYLQVVCRRLWDAMPKDDLSIGAEDLEEYADVSKALGAYYSDAVRAIAKGDVAVERALRDWIGDKLIIGGIRSQVRQEQGASGGLDNRLIEALLDSYLVRTEQRAGANWYELSHDRLVDPIQQDNEAWERAHLHPLQVQSKLWESGGRTPGLLYSAEALPSAIEWVEQNPGLLTEAEQDFLEASRLRHRELAQRRRRERGFMAAVSAVALVALVLAGIALSLRKTANEEKEAAKTAGAEATRNAVAATEAQQEAKDQATKARSLAKKAEEEAEKAMEARAKSQQAVRQMFRIPLMGFIENVVKQELPTGELEIDDRWVPLLGPDDQPVVAASADKRILAAGHGAVLVADPAFLEITAEWMFTDQVQSRILIVTRQASSREHLERLQMHLTGLGYEHEVISELSADALEHAEMLIIADHWQDFSDAEVSAVAAFVDRGAGVLAIGEARAWRDQAASATIDRYPMNVLMRGFGVEWTEQIVEPGAFEMPKIKIRFENESGAVRLLSPPGADHITLEPNSVRELRIGDLGGWTYGDENGDPVSFTTKNEGKIIVFTKRTRNVIPKTFDQAKRMIEQTAKTKCRSWGIHSIKLDVRVDDNGKVVSAKTASTDASSGMAVAHCVEGVVKKQRFPANQGKAVTWRLKF